MSYLPRNIRIEAAARAFEEIQNSHAIAADLDAGFDGGEFSGPAHDAMADQECIEVAARFRLTVDEIWPTVLNRDLGDDPLGDWHGRNE